jgi:hypothetical protein
MVAASIDLGLLKFFVGIFIFLLTFVISYGFLSYRKPFGEGNEGLYGLIALAIAITVIAFRPVAELITFLTPWFFMMLFFAFFAIFILSVFGLDPDTLGPDVDSRLRNVFITVSVILLIFGLSTVFGQETLEAGPGNADSGDDGSIEPRPNETDTSLESADTTDTGSFQQNLINTLTHPKVLGLIAFMVIVSFAMFFLTRSPTQ